MLSSETVVVAMYWFSGLAYTWLDTDDMERHGYSTTGLHVCNCSVTDSCTLTSLIECTNNQC